MAFDPTSAADAAALVARRERLRAWSLRIAGAVEAIPMPQSYRDGERAARAVTVADRMLARLPETEDESVSPARQRLRVFADDLFSTVEDLPLPKTFIEGERAGRCVLATERLFTQLYTPSKPLKTLCAALEADPDPDGDGEDRARTETAFHNLFNHIDQLSLAFAREIGFYPDGSACGPAALDNPEHLTCPREHTLITEWIDGIAGKPLRPGDGKHFFALMITARANASTRAQARHTGHWPDGSAYKEDAPDFWAISKAFPAEVLQRPGPIRADLDESPGPPLFPWWIVRADTG